MRAMHAELMAALTECWLSALQARAAMSPRSPVAVLDALLQALAQGQESAERLEDRRQDRLPNGSQKGIPAHLIKPRKGPLTWVGLLVRYSNRPDLCDDLHRAIERLRTATAREAAWTLDRVSVCSERKPSVWKVADRLSEADVAEIITRFERGTAKRILAEQFGIGMTALKKLLKHHGVRQAWKVRDRLSETDVSELIVSFHDGTPKRELAERYGISLSAVKNLLRGQREDGQ